MKKQYKNRQIIMKLMILLCIAVMLPGCGTGGEDTSPSHTGNISSAEEAGGSGPQVISPEDMKPDYDSAPDDETAQNQEGAAREDTVQTQDSSTGNQAASDPTAQQLDGQEAGLYEQFLYNGRKVTVSDEYPKYEYEKPIVQRGSSYTLEELSQIVSAYFLDPAASCDSIKYTYIECLDGGAKKLLIQFNGLDIYSVDDDSYAVFVVSEDHGQLYLTDRYQCWARNVTTAYRNGCLNTFGSGGAGDHYDGLQVILSDGRITDLYSSEILSGPWADLGGDVYYEVFGEDTVEPGLVVCISIIGDERYYTYSLSECSQENLSLCETYIDRCENELEIYWVTDEEMQAAVRDRCALLGIDYDKTQDSDEVTWNNL